MRKEPVWRDGNHMVFESAHKTFNRKVGAIIDGQVIGNCQTSYCIRPYNETECNGREYPPGNLRNCDFDWFKDVPNHVREYVESVTQNEGVVLYHFFHYYTDKQHVTRKFSHGWVVVRGYRETSTLLRSFVTGRGFKSHSVIAEAIPYLIS